MIDLHIFCRLQQAIGPAECEGKRFTSGKHCRRVWTETGLLSLLLSYDTAAVAVNKLTVMLRLDSGIACHGCQYMKYFI